MRSRHLAPALLLGALLLGVLMMCVMTSAPVLAANADAPYSNVDKSNDRGNDTGDSRVDSLNRSQLDENQPRQAPAAGTVIVTPGVAAPRAGSYAPAPAR
jgi:hypothetical protein